MRAAIVLGGGRSSRMGTDKLALERGGVTMLAHTCRAAARFADRVIVAGHEQPELDVEFVLEDPPFGGPVAGIATAVVLLVGEVPGPSTGRRRPAQEPLTGGRPDPGQESEVLVLAGDLANPESVVEILAAAEMGPDGVVLSDEDGWPQYLAGRYTLAGLRRAVEVAEDVRNLSVRRFLRVLAVNAVPAPRAATEDVDTPESALTWANSDISATDP